jgi:hypothetical protein
LRNCLHYFLKKDCGAWGIDLLREVELEVADCDFKSVFILADDDLLMPVADHPGLSSDIVLLNSRTCVPPGIGFPGDYVSSASS